MGIRLYILRHGETDWNKAKKVQGSVDIPLNGFGRQLAKGTAKGFGNIHFDLAYTSPLLRAKETAEIILEGRETPLHIDKRLEEINFGIYEGMLCDSESNSEEFWAFDKLFTKPDEYIPVEGETLESLSRRTGDFLEELQEKFKGQDKQILIATHGATLNALLNHVKGNHEIANFWPGSVFPNCGVAVVNVEDGDYTIEEEGVVYHQEQVYSWEWEDV
jgi:probable phosphoglycerate mutase